MLIPLFLFQETRHLIYGGNLWCLLHRNVSQQLMHKDNLPCLLQDTRQLIHGRNPCCLSQQTQQSPLLFSRSVNSWFTEGTPVVWTATRATRNCSCRLVTPTVGPRSGYSKISMPRDWQNGKMRDWNFLNYGMKLFIYSVYISINIKYNVYSN